MSCRGKNLGQSVPCGFAMIRLIKLMQSRATEGACDSHKTDVLRDVGDFLCLALPSFL